ncbi:glycerophosphodiester phosphodiesterase family protein [Chitinophaga nivalis]|uniref:Glycerophosphodiester phosphodiesterase family protein n=1 Tax=Chitinophaga nivalis TaxID=2991709 RepID=A0ABT3IID0_9BACT|nr:glycerophosphodiester phosphodiesterase family protein [Chitinophaga nivalis]MCW3466622.1 glycerophosphodiester phosphodiesterase family protein [Chitinophaga nivalis]MCW3483687.1 glycerophosphodiester phosphodiesterase family protein [Chitinophaga nivalis]
MKYCFFIVLLICSTWHFTNAQTTEPAKGNIDLILNDFHQRPDRIMVAAHRAAHTHYPENSLAAINEAIRQGIDIVELDVRQTKDSVLVLMHDETLKRTTGRKGKVSSFTYEELKQLRLLHNGQPTTEKIPTFEEALLLAKGNIIIDVDFKADDPGAARRTCALIAATGTAKQVMFFLYDPKYVPFLQGIDKQIYIMPKAHDAAETAAILGMGKFPAIHVDPSFYTDDLMNTIRAAGSRVWINALGESDDMERVAPNTGFDLLLSKYKRSNIIQTDLPEQLLRYLREKGLHQ